MSGNLRKNILALFGLQALTYILPLLSLPYLARVLGTENFGRMALALAVAQYFVVLVDYGFSLSATRRVALEHADASALARVVSSVTLLRLLFCLAGAVVLLLAIKILPALAGDPSLYALAYLVVVGNALLPTWLFQGLGQAYRIAACSIVGQLLSLIGLLLLVRDASDYRIAAVLQAAAPIAAAVLAWGILWRGGRVRWTCPSPKHAVETLREGWPFFLSLAATHLYTTSNTVMLGLLSTPQAVGWFAAADKIVRAAQGLQGPVAQSVYPHIARLSAESQGRAMALIGAFLRWQSLATLVISALLFLLAEPLTMLIFGPEFAESAAVLRWLALLPFLTGISNVLGIQTMINFGMKSSFSRIVVVCGVFNVAMLAVLAPVFGASGAAASVLATETAVVLLMGWALLRAGLLPRVLRGAT